MFRTILVAVDGTRTSSRALAAAIGLAKDEKAALHIVHVIDELVMASMVDPSGLGVAQYVESMLESLAKVGRKVIADAERAASKDVANVHAEVVSSRGQPVATVILRYAKRVGADLIVLGTHGRRGIGRLVMGSDAETVVREATVPVLLVRNPAAQRKASKARKEAKSPTSVERARRRSERAVLARGAG
jgi:nucleotide-binding universal stress UspA family protein